MPTWLSDLLQDSAAVAIIASSIATSLTFLGGIAVYIINQRSLANKEERRWDHERELEREKRERQDREKALAEQRAEKERIRNLYFNCIRSVNTIASMHGVDYNKHVPEANQWLSSLLLHLGDRDDQDKNFFRHRLDSFIEDPTKESKYLLDIILKLSLQEDSIFSSQSSDEPPSQE